MVEVHAHRGGFWRHFVEMSVAMWIGMAVGGIAFGVLLTALGSSTEAARSRFPEAAVLIMGINMTAPMVAWMRHRGHPWRSSAEMSAAMLLPAVPCILLLRTGTIQFASMCGVYCVSMTVAMLAVMLFRREEYGWRSA